MSIKVRNEDKEFEEVYKKAEVDNLIKIKEYTASVDVGANATFTAKMGEREEIDGYTIIGVIPKASGHVGHWQVTFGFYSKDIQVHVKNFHTAQLTANVSCYVLYVKTEALSIL